MSETLEFTKERSCDESFLVIIRSAIEWSSSLSFSPGERADPVLCICQINLALLPPVKDRAIPGRAKDVLVQAARTPLALRPEAVELLFKHVDSIAGLHVNLRLLWLAVLTQIAFYFIPQGCPAAKAFLPHFCKPHHTPQALTAAWRHDLSRVVSTK